MCYWIWFEATLIVEELKKYIKIILSPFPILSPILDNILDLSRKRELNLIN